MLFEPSATLNERTAKLHATHKQLVQFQELKSMRAPGQRSSRPQQCDNADRRDARHASGPRP